MKKVLNIYRIFALFLHELSHVIVGSLLFNKVDYMYVKINRKGELCGMVVWDKHFRNLFEEILVSFAPLFLMLFFVGMCFVSKFFLIVVIYQITTIKLSIPSKGDVFNVKNFNLFKKFGFDAEKVNEYKLSIGEPSIYTVTKEEDDEEMRKIEEELLSSIK